MKLRTSPTELEAVRYYRRIEEPDIEKLKDSLLRRGEVNEKMLAGSAFHGFLETIKGSRDLTGQTFEHDGHKFQFDAEGEFFLPGAREIKTEKVYRVGGVEVTVAAVADALDAITVSDHKLVSKFDPEAYYVSSLQWRCYLDMFQCRRFVYNVFTGSHQKKDDVWKIRSLDRFELYTYDGITKDIYNALEDLVNICKQHVPEKFTHGLEESVT